MSTSCRSSWPYYRRLLRENIVSHKEENDPERLKLMFETAARDADWVVAKVQKTTHRQCTYGDMHSSRISTFAVVSRLSMHVQWLN